LPPVPLPDLTFDAVDIARHVNLTTRSHTAYTFGHAGDGLGFGYAQQGMSR
jgi:hypothetical protein